MPAAGAVNLIVVATLVPNAGTPAGKLNPVDGAVKAAVAVLAVAGEMVTAGMSFTDILTAGESPPPHAARVATSVRPTANLGSVAPVIENLSMLRSLFMKLEK